MDEHKCEFCDCEEEGTVYEEFLQAWLCEKHAEGYSNSTGYCSRDCQLGYGCTGSC